MKVKKVLKIMRDKYGWRGDISEEHKVYTQTVINATLEAMKDKKGKRGTVTVKKEDLIDKQTRDRIMSLYRYPYKWI
tara:strand:+ start:1300 stop:1530 length:231 start_codon:yes stop_codon:yes gene_type:complete